MPSSMISCPVKMPVKLNMPSMMWPWKMSPGMYLVGGMYLSG